MDANWTATQGPKMKARVALVKHFQNAKSKNGPFEENQGHN
jgi:hypothetical protein